MTFLEILLVGSCGIVFGLRALGIPSRPGAQVLHTATLAVPFLLHLGIDGPRWQMIPAYFLTVLLGAGGTLSRSTPSDPPPLFKEIKWALWVLAGGWLFGSFLLPSAFPVSQWRAPTGDFPIGTQRLLLTDTSRTEPFEPGSGAFREITAQAWYPAESGCGKSIERYWRNPVEMSSAWARANDMGWISFIWSHLGRIPIHACEGASISSEHPDYPVLVFSHGYWQTGSFNTALIEEMASQGYVVLSISHPFETPFSVYPDGRLREFSRENPEFQRRVAEEGNVSRWMILEEIHQATTWEEQEPLYEEWYAGIPAWQESNTIWMDDILFSISELSGLDLSTFGNRLDLEHIGAVGFSFGGGASGLAAMADSRIKAGVNIDGFQYGHTMEHNIRVPFMFISSEGHRGGNTFFFERAEDAAYDLTVEGTSHSNFTDLALLAALPGWLSGRLGRIDGDRGITILTSYVVAFLDKHLKGTDSGLLSGPSPDYPEVTIRTRNLERE